jgi:hypothetical protein
VQAGEWRQEGARCTAAAIKACSARPGCPPPPPTTPQSGDVFQLVLSQRFERRTFADPFEIYR